LAADGRPGAAILAATRAAGRTADAGPLSQLVAEHAVRLDEAARKDHTWEVRELVDKLKRMNADPERIVAVLLQAVLDGGEASYLLRAVAQTVDSVHTGQSALDVIRGAIALDPSKLFYEDTHALVLMSLTRWDEASAAIERLAAGDPGQAAWLRTYLGMLTEPFGFWPATDRATDIELADDDPPSARTGEMLAEAVRIAAGRVETVSDALAALVGPVAWRPVLSDVPDADPGDDDIDVSGIGESVPNLIAALRLEWTRLVWLCYSSGLDRVGMPVDPAPRRPLGVVDTLLTVRYNLLCGVADGETPEIDQPLDREMAPSTWAGTPVMELAPHLANVALDEHVAALAAVRWVANPDPDGSFDALWEA
jgi:hypothetical protein